jgi:uncharacterized membrane protein
MFRISTALRIIASLLLPAGLWAGQMYTVTDLGIFGNSIFVTNLNDSGAVVGGGQDASGVIEAFRWTNASGFLFVQAPGSTFTRIWDINSAGLMAGDYDTGNNTIGNNTHAFIDDGTQLQVLPSLPNTNPTQFDSVYTINSAGTIGGSSIKVDSFNNNSPTAAIWPLGGAVQGFTAGGTITGLNDNGQMIGNSLGNLRAMLWNGGAPTIIGPFAGDTYSQANAINNLGEVIGVSGILDGSPARMFLYSGGALSQVGSTCIDRPYVFDINDSSQIVGQCSNFAALFSSGQVIDLNQVIPSSPGLFLTSARAINSSGQIAVNGAINGVNHAFLLTPIPEPGSAMSLALALMPLLIYKRKR